MHLREMAAMMGGQWCYRGTTVLVWNGEARFARGVDAVVEVSDVAELTVTPPPREEVEAGIRVPPPATSGEATLLAAVNAVLDRCIDRGWRTVLLPVVEMAGADTDPTSLGRYLALGLIRRLDEGLDLDGIVVADHRVARQLSRGMHSLVTDWELGGEKTYVRVHDAEGPEPVADRGGQLDVAPLADVPAGAHGTWTLTYTVGERLAGRAEIDLAITHPSNWELPQFILPAASGYTTVRTDGDAALLAWVNTACGSKGFLLQAVVWDGELTAGDHLVITLGDTSAGAPGIRAQKRVQQGQRFKVFGDLADAVKMPWQHNDWCFGHADSPTLDIVPAAAAMWYLVIPSDAVVGQPFTGILRVMDAVGNLCPDHAETLVVEAPDGTRHSVELTAADGGFVAVPDLRVDETGVARFRVLTPSGEQRCLSNPAIVRTAPPEHAVYWGDLHIHSNLSDGLGEPEANMRFARDVIGLEIGAFADHDMVLQPNEGFWERTKTIIRDFHDPGSFVTLLGYEYTERTYGGDRNVYYLEDDGPLYDFNSVPTPAELYALLREREGEALVIPHCCIGRHVWEHTDPELCPVAEVYSTHGSSEAYPNDRPLQPMSQQLNLYPQESYTDSFAHGLRLGVVGGTDDHGAQPGWGYTWHDYRGGIMGVHMPALTRASLWDALYGRRTIATTGERILLNLRIGDLGIGATGTVAGTPVLEIEAHGTAKIDLVEVLRNEAIVHCFHGRELDETRLFADRDWDGRPAAYRVRLTQADGERAWTSPIWVRRD